MNWARAAKLVAVPAHFLVESKMLEKLLDCYLLPHIRIIHLVLVCSGASDPLRGM